jgi:hypothetical protein
MNTTSICANCRFFDAKKKLCRKTHPGLYMLPTQNKLTNAQAIQGFGFWPPVSENDWCGEFETEFALDT